MQSEITTEIGMNQRIMTTGIRIGGVNRFHSSVQTKNKIVKIQPETQPIGNSYLFPETLQAELSAGLFRIIADRPDITGIYKHRTVQFPEQEPSPPVKRPGPSSLTDQPRTLFAPPLKYRFSYGRIVELP